MEDKITAWLARDKSGILFMYTRKPVKGKSCNAWYLDAEELGGVGIEIDDGEIYSQVKWEDSEPTEVELTIKIKE